jgi:hypothetical protein
VVSDGFFFHDFKGEKWAVTHFTDYLVDLSAGDLTKHPTSQFAADTFFERWLSVYGPPDTLLTDQGPEYHGSFALLADLYGFSLEYTDAVAKWKHGKAERHGAIAKIMLIKVVNEMQLSDPTELRHAVGQVFAAKNTQIRSCGWSPVQATQGRDSTIPSALVDQMASGRIRLGENAALMKDVHFSKMERIRQAARAAFVWLDSHNDLRVALSSRPRPPSMSLVPIGTQVYYLKPPKEHMQSARLEDQALAWYGPAIVIQHEGPSELWLRFRKELRRVPVENVRLASPNELLGSKHVTEALSFLETELGRGQRPRLEVIAKMDEDLDEMPKLDATLRVLTTPPSSPGRTCRCTRPPTTATPRS